MISTNVAACGGFVPSSVSFKLPFWARLKIGDAQNGGFPCNFPGKPTQKGAQIQRQTHLYLHRTLSQSHGVISRAPPRPAERRAPADGNQTAPEVAHKSGPGSNPRTPQVPACLGHVLLTQGWPYLGLQYLFRDQKNQKGTPFSCGRILQRTQLPKADKGRNKGAWVAKLTCRLAEARINHTGQSGPFAGPFLACYFLYLLRNTHCQREA